MIMNQARVKVHVAIAAIVYNGFQNIYEVVLLSCFFFYIIFFNSRYLQWKYTSDYISETQNELLIIVCLKWLGLYSFYF